MMGLLEDVTFKPKINEKSKQLVRSSRKVCFVPIPQLLIGSPSELLLFRNGMLTQWLTGFIPASGVGRSGMLSSVRN